MESHHLGTEIKKKSHTGYLGTQVGSFVGDGRPTSVVPVGDYSRQSEKSSDRGGQRLQLTVTIPTPTPITKVIRLTIYELCGVKIFGLHMVEYTLQNRINLHIDIVVTWCIRINELIEL